MVKYDAFLKAYRKAHEDEELKHQYSEAQRLWNESKNVKDKEARNKMLEEQVSEFNVKAEKLKLKKKQRWHGFFFPKDETPTPSSSKKVSDSEKSSEVYIINV